MTSNVFQLADARAKAELRKKIEGLQKSISEKRRILEIREDYLNKLSGFQKYDTIRIECHDLFQKNLDLSMSIGIMEMKLTKFEKELNE